MKLKQWSLYFLPIISYWTLKSSLIYFLIFIKYTKAIMLNSSIVIESKIPNMWGTTMKDTIKWVSEIIPEDITIPIFTLSFIYYYYYYEQLNGVRKRGEPAIIAKEVSLNTQSFLISSTIIKYSQQKSWFYLVWIHSWINSSTWIVKIHK